MALKKRKTCKSEKEHLYMLEILVDRLDLNPEKGVFHRDNNPMIRVGFIDLTPVDIIVERLVNAEGNGKNGKNKEKRSPDEQRVGREPGKSYLFVRAPSDLVRSTKSTPLSIEVYRIPRKGSRDSRADSRILLCAATAFLPDCFCDRVVAAKDKIDGLSTPCTLRKSYTLYDERGSSCGSVSFYLRFSSFGSSIVEHLALREKSYVFQGFPLGQKKFRCAESPDEDLSGETNQAKSKDNTPLLNEILGPASSKLYDREDAASTLTRPESPPRVSMGQPGFENLTSAEKLNDPKYRSLIYKAYPDEPTCSCLPADQSTHPLVCRSGCTRSCCMSLRNPDVLKSNNNDDPRSKSADAYSAVNCRDDDVFRENPRTRNGGEVTWSNSEMLWSEKCTRRGGDINLKHRLAGGSEYAYAPSEPMTTVIYQKGASASPPCRRRPRTADGIMAGCVCPGGKDPSLWKTGTSKCAKKPCVGADCFMRAFKEAQDFVDSIGKVPGLAGLGLMDPTESPYFGRDLDRDYVAIHEVPSERRRVYPATSLQCTAPCNTQIGRPIAPSPYIPATTTVPGRPGVVREAIPTLPEATLVPVAVKPPRKKEEKKEEKAEKQKELDVSAISVPPDIDVGPCNEPKCKSRRKTPGDERTVPREITEEAQKSAVQPKPPSTITARSVGKPSERGRHMRGKVAGPSGDRDIGRPGAVRVSKRVMRYVYSIGDVYPGISYGHKNCIDPRMRVPANMGWLWNITDTVAKRKPRIGWKPGAIARYVNELLREAKAGSLEEDSRSRSVPSRTAIGRRGKVYKTTSYVSVKKSQAKMEGEEEMEPPPTLHIHRKDGTYYVTMYPIKQETSDVPRLEEPTKPLQFKIVKNRDDASVASSSTASDMEIEFSPPAAVNRYRKKPDVTHVDTQVRQQEILDALKPAEAPKRKEKKEKKGRRGRRERK